MERKGAKKNRTRNQFVSRFNRKFEVLWAMLVLVIREKPSFEEKTRFLPFLFLNLLNCSLAPIQKVKTVSQQCFLQAVQRSLEGVVGWFCLCPEYRAAQVGKPQNRI
jgi:hypothetical protein